MAHTAGIRRKIIYVDDVNYSLLSLKHQLKDRYEIYTAQSAAKMFELLMHITPDLILLDINMQGADGYETIQKLKADLNFADIPVIFLTSRSDKASMSKGIALGAAAYVNKPYDIPFLVEQIESVFSGRRRNPFRDILEDTNKPRILAVDDVPAMLRTLNFALRDKYNVYTLTKPDEMKDFLRRIRPDLFLLDYNMPGISGLDIIPIIREFPEHRETPVIFISANNTAKIIEAATGLGACDYIVKPVDIAVLHEKIEKHIQCSTTYRPWRGG